MSDNGGGGIDQEPMAKKQRNFTEAELGGPIEDEETAREKLEKAGFDPDDVTKAEYVDIPEEEPRLLPKLRIRGRVVSNADRCNLWDAAGLPVVVQSRGA